MNLQALIDWGLVNKELKSGNRTDYLSRKSHVGLVRKIVQRKRRELEPLLKIQNEVLSVEGDSNEIVEFQKTVQDTRLFSNKADALLESFLKAEADRFIKSS